MTDPSTLNWFHGRITRDTAEKNLSKTQMKDGTYLLRESTQHIGSYVLSVCKDKKVMWFTLNILNDQGTLKYVMSFGIFHKKRD